ncbi:hypothetical protein D7S78_15365 [Ralstonia pickettii]|nr:hypothetical protein [Ralstonia pickettii]MBA9851722.1 hypothetical protein [Ralstonia pickettii]MBA9878458.1 hypothetical protein [Ralstonia pickettii]MBA9883272.1 hypothetical protein [Ralstonia pickettii]MBA9888241.1 hypothetical protein [Ralstonia pickettii]
MPTEISSASTEQSTGIEQVDIAVGQIEGVTQQNAAMAEEASAAANAVAEQAGAPRRAAPRRLHLQVGRRRDWRLSKHAAARTGTPPTESSPTG